MDKEVKCNICGKTMDFFDLQQDFTIHKKVQYGSDYDGCTVDFHICCGCFDSLVDKCVLDPTDLSHAYPIGVPTGYKEPQSLELMGGIVCQ